MTSKARWVLNPRGDLFVELQLALHTGSRSLTGDIRKTFFYGLPISFSRSSFASFIHQHLLQEVFGWPADSFEFPIMLHAIFNGIIGINDITREVVEDHFMVTKIFTAQIVASA